VRGPRSRVLPDNRAVHGTPVQEGSKTLGLGITTKGPLPNPSCMVPLHTQSVHRRQLPVFDPDVQPTSPPERGSGLAVGSLGLFPFGL